MDIAQDEDAEAQKYPTSQQWESRKSIMYDLYIKQGLSLLVVQKIMARYGHNASCRMYKSRFAEWDFGKNTSKQDWQAFVILRARARAAGSELRQVQIHSRIRNLPELERYLRKQDISEADFFQEAMKAEVSVPDHVQSVPVCVGEVEQPAIADDGWELTGRSDHHWTDEESTCLQATQDVGSLPSHSSFDIAQGSTRGGSITFEDPHLQDFGFHTWLPGNKPCDQEYPVHDHFQSPSGDIPPELSTYLTQVANPMTGIMPPGPSFVDLSEMAGLFNAPFPPQVPSHSPRELDLARGASKLFGHMLQPLTQNRHELGQNEGVHNVGEIWHLTSDSPPTFALPMPVPGSLPDPAIQYAQTTEHYAFMGDIFMACMSAAARNANQNVEIAQIWMKQAIIKLKMMCGARDPMLLVTIHMALVWLQVHDTESRAESLIEKLSQATAVELGGNSSIAIILEYMVSAAGKRLPNSRIDFVALHGVVRDFGAQLGPEHPHTLVALYYVYFHMMRVDHQFAEAERELTKLYRSTSKILGKSSFQSVCVLATLSRAQSRQNKHHAALDTIRQCLQEAPLGLNHPHRLELLMREALICWSLKDKLKPEEQNERLYLDGKIEQLYWIVARGRVATLGRYHQRTEAAHETLVDILIENGRYETDSVKGEALELLTKPQVAVSDYERWWWTMVPKDREGGDEPPAPSAATA